MFEQLIAQANAARLSGEITGDPYADDIAREAAEELTISRLGLGHQRALRAHVRALVAGYGAEHVAGVLADLWGALIPPEERTAFEVAFGEWAREHHRPNRK